MKQLTIGTAQWGLKYGLTNKNGQLTDDEIKKIVLSKEFSSILSLDTAQSYGNAEKIIGEISSICPDIQVTTKLKKLDEFNPNFLTNLKHSMHQSLKLLRKNQFDCLLLHDYDDTSNLYFDELCHLVDDLKRKGFIKRFGISIYCDQYLNDSLLQLFDVIQIPISIFDQRIMQSGLIKRIKDFGCHIQCRSIFMQGVLALSSLSGYKFSQDFIIHHEKWFHYCNNDERLMKQNALEFVASIPEIDEIIFGVTSYKELQEIYELWNAIQLKQSDSSRFLQWAWYDAHDVDPRLWR